MSTLCLHHNDTDGRASAAVVRRALGESVILKEMSYGDPTPWNLIEDVRHVVILDFSLSPPDMQRVANTRMLTWIDHHKSALEELDKKSNQWSGIRDLHEAACVLTWRYYFPDKPVPRALVLIGDRDIWRQEEPDSGAFNEGLRHERTLPDNDHLWKQLLEDDSAAVAALIEKGRPLLNARLDMMRRYVSRYGFFVTFEGWRTLAINQRGDGDLGQYIRDLGYDLAYCYVEGSQGEKIVTFVTLFSEKVDVSEIAKKYGGGGHPGAAGFSFERSCSPFPANSM